MFLSKIKVVSAFVVMMAAISGAGFGAYYLRAQDPSKQIPPPNPPAIPGIQIFGADNDEQMRKDLERLLKRVDEAVQNEKPAGKPEERFQKLLQVRRDMARDVRNIRYELYRAGANEPGTGNPVTLHLVIDASKCLLKAELELSNKRANRLKAREAHLKIMIEVAKITTAQYKVGRVSRAALASAFYEQMDADIELEREKSSGPPK